MLSSTLSFAAVLILGVPALALPAVQLGFNVLTILQVRSNMLQISNHSWEIGTALEALTELEWPTVSVVRASGDSLPIRLDIFQDAVDVREIAAHVVQTKTPGTLPLIDGDGAVGDPASIGSAVLLTNWTRSDLSDQSYAAAAWDQLDYLLYVAPRTEDGAISHRQDQVQLWADFVYMAPPFIAYYGALLGGDFGLYLMQTAYDQCRLYRNYLRDDNGLWRHITLGDSEDTSHWGTGNGWAAAGMIRVLETIRYSGQSSQLVEQQANLTTWVQEIVDAVWPLQGSNGTLFNVLDEPSTSFGDTSSTALLASTTYRLAALTGNHTHISAANAALHLIESSVDSDGWLLNTVDPYTFTVPSAPGVHSPEGQAFVLLLQSAWRDYIAYVAGLLVP